MTIRWHGDAAVVSSQVVSEGSRDGQPFATRLQVTQVWVRSGGQWRRAAFHDSRLPGSSRQEAAMELKDTLRAISNDARGWLKAWARDFLDSEARRPIGDGRAPNPLAWQFGHLACTEDDVAALFTAGPADARGPRVAQGGLCHRKSIAHPGYHVPAPGGPVDPPGSDPRAPARGARRREPG